MDRELLDAAHGINCTLSDLVETIKQADRGRNDALSVVGAIKAAIQMQDVEIKGLTERLEANEQAVQRCMTCLGEMNKVIQTIASKIPE